MPDTATLIVASLALTNALLCVVFLLAWRMLGEKVYALSWSLAYLAGTFQWLIVMNMARFGTSPLFWLTIQALALTLVTLGLRGHCQRTDCKILPKNLWPITLLVFAACVSVQVFAQHAGLSNAIVPFAGAVAAGLIAVMIVRHREETRPAEWAAAITFGLFGLSQVVASGISLMQGAGGDPYYQSLYFHFNLLALPVGYTAVAVFTIFMLASDLAEELREMAVQDKLTGLLNRRGFGELAASAYATARRTGKSVSVIATDIDRFKDINDTYGHALGDEALVHFARLMTNGRRADDVLARVGGEEFVLVLPGTDLHEALAVADSLCAALASTPITFPTGSLVMTASFGVATISNSDSCLSDVVARADKALYRSKRAGRNRVDLESSQYLRIADGEVQKVSSL